MRTINAAGLALVKRFEGLRLEAYLCPAKVWTIGYGHTAGVAPGAVCTEVEAGELLRLDLRAAEEAVEQLVRVRLTENQFSALVAFVFNVGRGNFSTSTLRRNLNAGAHENVPVQLLRWTKVNGRESRGLLNRRRAEAGLWSTPD